jgi:isopenicillin N synthase-like dioxygenase
MVTLMNGSALPVVDLSLATGSMLRGQVLAAARDVGAFYVRGHGVPRSLAVGVLEMARRLFALPAAQLREIENVRSPQFRGYSRPGGEHTGGRPDWREQFDVGLERPAVKLGPDDAAYLRLIGPNQWPAALPELRATTLAWQAEARRVSLVVMRLLAAALGQDEGYFDRWFDEEAAVYLKLMRYPGRGDAGDGQGIGVHRDYGYLGLLAQDEIGGLQVQARDGGWIDVCPRQGAFVVTGGEMLEVATDGYLKAPPHRVASPPAGVDRYSAAFFLAPRLDAVVEPMTLPPGLANKTTGISQDPDNPLLAAYGENALMGWLRSHPRVVERWWAGLDDRARASSD